MLNCPKCKNSPLQNSMIHKSLPALSCSSCEGHWLIFADYLSWQQKNSCKQTQEEFHGEFNDSSAALICPTCMKIMSKYKVSADTPFIIDQCGRCHGVWFDTNEWEAIKSQGLADQLHLLFTSHWQKNIQKELSDKRKLEIFINKFGQENFDKLTEIKSWLKDMPHKDAMLAFLRDE